MKHSVFYTQTLIIFLSVEMILAFSAFGFIYFSPISITLVPLVVLVGALSLGPVGGMILGGAFGLTSVWKASVSATDYADQIFSPFVSGEPLASLALSLGTRMAFGWLAGALFAYSQNRAKRAKLCVVLSALVADMFHSLSVLLCVWAFFPRVGISLEHIVARTVSPKNVVGYLIISVMILAWHGALRSQAMRRFRDEMNTINAFTRNRYTLPASLAFIAVLLFILGMLAYHFSTRIDVIAASYRIEIPSDARFKCWNVGLQFLVTIVALFTICVICFAFVEKYLVDLAYRAKRDMMTGLYNKNSFARDVDASLSRSAPSSFLLILDIDDFKRINDTYGHPIGDRVLTAVAGLLSERFRDCGIIGRLGGDELAAFAEGVTGEDMLRRTDALRAAVAGLNLTGERRVSCSVGIAPCAEKRSFSEAYAAADKALYQAKRKGKDFCVILE